MSEAQAFALEPAEWPRAADALRAVRREVFVVEQRVPEELEWDGHDAASRHVLARARDGTPIGTGRLLPDGHIGRMAVLKAWRRRGVGSALLGRLVEIAARDGHAAVVLHAQTHAVPFYERHGFATEGAEFLEAGIPHVVMTRRLAPART